MPFINSLLVLLLLASAAAAVYEALTASIELGRVERGLALAAKAEEFRLEIGSPLTTAQAEIYNTAIATSARVMVGKGRALDARRTLLKFSFALLPWILFALMYLSTDEKDRYTGTFGAILVGVPLAGAFSLVPDFMWPVFNLAILPALPFAVVMAIAVVHAKRKRRVA